MKYHKQIVVVVALMLTLSLFLSIVPAMAEENFADLVGNVTVGDVQSSGALQVPFITWGGDMVTFYANGGKTTAAGTLFKEQGLNLNLVPGDNFVQQVKDYLTGKSPFLRGTYRMMGMASEVISKDPRTKGIVIMQLTWSAGDHMVVRSHIKTVENLKGKNIVLQKGGPHVGMLDDILKTGNLTWDDVKITWANDLTASANSPAELLRKDSSIDACFVISPDMIGLTGGLQNIGSGAEGTIKGARVLVSTADLSRSIADVYVCRKDYYDANKEQVMKFVAGYFKGCEDVISLKKQYESKGSKKYMELLQMTQDIYGSDVIPTLEEDAHGLLSDCTLVGYPGNLAFFRDANNLSGFDAFNKSAVDLAVGRGYAAIRCALFANDFDYNNAAFTSYLKTTKVTRTEKFKAEAVQREIEELSSGGAIDDKTIVSFTIQFEPNQNDFSVDQYGAEYQRVIEMADKYGNAVIAIRGHSDPTKTLLEMVKAGMKKGILKRSGSKGNYRYSLNGKALDLNATDAVSNAVQSGAFDGHPDHKPREIMQAALNLSRKRAEAVRNSILEYAKTKKITIDASQIQPVGVGIREPFIAKPNNMDDARQNMRVEFRLLKVSAEVSNTSDFDF